MSDFAPQRPLCKASLTSQWNNSACISLSEHARCLCVCFLCVWVCVSLKQVDCEGRQSAWKHMQRRARTDQSRSSLIKKHSGDGSDSVKECVCGGRGVLAWSAIKWNNMGPRGFHLRIRTLHSNKLWLFYVGKKLIISPTVAEGWDGEEEGGRRHWRQRGECLTHLILHPDAVWESLINCCFRLLFLF